MKAKNITIVNYFDNNELLLETSNSKKLIFIDKKGKKHRGSGSLLKEDLSMAEKLEKTLYKKGIKITKECFNNMSSVDYDDLSSGAQKEIDELKLEQLNKGIINFKLSNSLLGIIASSSIASSIYTGMKLHKDSTAAVAMSVCEMAIAVGCLAMSCDNIQSTNLLRKERALLLERKLNI